MRQTTTLLSLLLIFCITDQSFSAVFWYFQGQLYIEDYIKSREASYHRGLFLSYSLEQKKLLCRDHFSAQLYVIPTSADVDDILITDGQITAGEHQYDLIVSEISLIADENDEVIKKNEMFIECFGTFFERRIPYSSGQYFISYGFQYGRWLASTGLTTHDQEHIVLGHNIGTSPQYVPMERIKLEERYVTTREIIEKLRDESPAYIRLIELKDDLGSLTSHQRAVLCASVLSSPIYREERLEYSTKWILDHPRDFVYDEQSLFFTYHNERGKKNAMICDCFTCKGFANGNDMNSKSTNLYITRSYDNHNSIYIMKPHTDFIFMDKYFKRIAILTNAEKLFKNFNEKESFESSFDD